MAGCLEKDTRGAVDTGRAAQDAGHDPASLHRRLERATRDFTAERHEQAITCLRHATADDHDFRVEDVHQVGDARPEELGGLQHHLECQRIAMRRRLIHRLRGDVGEVAPREVGDAALRAGLDVLDGAARDRGTRCVRLEAAVVAALALAALGVDGGVPDLTRRVRRAVQQLAESKGWTVRRIKTDDGCYEIKGRNAAGDEIEVKVNPATLEIIEIETEDGDDEEGDENPSANAPDTQGAAPGLNPAPKNRLINGNGQPSVVVE